MASVKKTTVTTTVTPETEETRPGMSFEDGIVLSTSLILVIAVVLAYLQYSSFYGS